MPLNHTMPHLARVIWPCRDAKMKTLSSPTSSRLGGTPLVSVLPALLVLAMILGPGTLQAQGRGSPERGPQRLPAFGRSIVSVEDDTAVTTNPANLAFLPGPELRWQGNYLDEAAKVPGQGHAFLLGFPFPLIDAGTALRFELINPPTHTESTQAEDYQWLTWGLGVGAGSSAIGASIQRTYSGDRSLNRLISWSLGVTWRPLNALGFAFVANHLNAPRNDSVGFMDRTYDFGVALRPAGSRLLELGLEGRYVNAPREFWVPRGTLGLDVPPLGRIVADLAVSDPLERTGPLVWQASAGLSVSLNGPTASTELVAGTTFGSRLGEGTEYEAHHNLYHEVALRTWREPVGPNVPRFAVRVRLEGTPDARGHVALLRQLWALAERERGVDAVVLEMKAPPVSSLAQAQELRDAIRYLRLRGKRVLCHLDDGRGTTLYVCAMANRIVVQPATTLRFAGLRTRHFYYQDLLSKLGIRADFVRIGEHKSAPESYTRTGASDTARADTIDLLQQYERHIMGGIAAGRRLSVEQARDRVKTGPFLPHEAKRAGFIDGSAFDDQLKDQVESLVGRPTQLVKAADVAPRAPERFEAMGRIALVYADGQIVDGYSRHLPFIGGDLVGSYTLAETLAAVREDENIGVVVLRIDSPGGSATAADVMWRELQLTARVKPVVVSMGSVAASGGYYIAAPATRIFASPLTITGSIGVYVGKADVSELLGRLGVNVEVYKTTPRADGNSIYRPFTPDERAELSRKIGQYYHIFLTRVADGRKLSREQADKAGQGRVWTGEQAQELKLVDEVGGLRQALEYARRIAHLPPHAPIVELPERKTTILGRILGLEGIRAGRQPIALPAQLEELVAAMAPFVIYPNDQPLALMDLVEIAP